MTRIVTGVAVAALLVACNAISGAADLEVAPASDVAPGVSRDGGPTSSEGGTVDPPAPPLPGCGATGVCVPSEPGWTPVASPRKATTACPSAYATATDLATTPTGDACNCTCTPSDPTACSSLKVKVSYGSTGCTDGAIDVNFPAPGGCVPYTRPSTGLYLGWPNVVGASGAASCTASAQPSFTPPPAVRVCGGATTSADGCNAGELCVPAVSGSARQCLVHDGDVACPAGFANRTLLGDGATDTRACTACACATDASCSAGKLEWSPSVDCSTINIDIGYGECTASATIKALRYQPSNGCKVATPSTVTGGVTFASTKTLCCR